MTTVDSSGEAPAVGALLDLHGHTALVTGASAGIGAGIAVRLAEAGSNLVVHFRNQEDAARELAAGIAAGGSSAITCRADLTDPLQIDHLLREAEQRLGVPDILVNNAGTYPVTPLLDMSPEEWQAVIESNLTTVHLVTQAVARRLRHRGRAGAIVNIASIEASNVAPAHSHYAAAKAGVVMYTRSAARELGPFGIRVNVVSPGLIWRPGLDEAWPEGVSRYQAGAPLGRLGRVADVADACLFLVSAASRWITGSELIVDGGILTSCAY